MSKKIQEQITEELADHIDMVRNALGSTASRHGLQADHVNAQSLDFAVKFTSAVIRKDFENDEMKFRLMFVRWLTSFHSYNDMVGVTTAFANTAHFVKYMIETAYQGKVDNYMAGIKEFRTRSSKYAATPMPSSATPFQTDFLNFKS